MVAWKIVAGLALGLGIGWIAGVGARASERVGWTDRTGMLAVSTGLTAFSLALGHVLSVNGILITFGAALMLNQLLTKHEGRANEVFNEEVKRLFEQPVFFLLGMALPIGGWLDLGWPLLAFCVGVLAFRRLPLARAGRADPEPLANEAGRGLHGLVRSHRDRRELLRPRRRAQDR